MIAEFDALAVELQIAKKQLSRDKEFDHSDVKYNGESWANSLSLDSTSIFFVTKLFLVA